MHSGHEIGCRRSHAHVFGPSVYIYMCIYLHTIYLSLYIHALKLQHTFAMRLLPPRFLPNQLVGPAQFPA